MNKKFMVAVDSGKHTTKAVMRLDNSIHRIKFRTKVEEVSNMGAEVASNTYLLEYDSRNYLIGDMLSEEKTDFSLSKQTIPHKLCVYLAITKLLEKSKDSIAFANVDLALNIPLNLYKNEQQKRSFSEFIQNEGKLIAMSVNGKAFAFRINSILFFASRKCRELQRKVQRLAAPILLKNLYQN